jgi:phosphate transport system substrate-binding protein
MKTAHSPLLRAAAVALGVTFVSALHGAPARAATSVVALTETGSTLVYPLFQSWITDFEKSNHGVRMSAAPTGSENGVAQAMSGAVQIGTSDAFMSDEQLKSAPQLINIPLAIAAQSIVYNVPGLAHTALRLDGPTLSGIYSGTIRSWDAPEIASSNPGVQLPHHAIVPIHRRDGSGDTFVFSQFLSFADSAWSDAVGSGTTIPWPDAPGALTALGNAGMVQAARAHPYSIAYVGVSFERQIEDAGLGSALVKSQDGAYLKPTPATILAAASALDPRTPPDERLSLVFAPGAGAYPLVNYEYAIVSTKQPSAAQAAAIRAFLLWSIEPWQGNAPKHLDAVHFIPLPEYVRALSFAQIDTIK